MDSNKLSEEREILQFISQTHRSEFDRRRVYEWRILLSTLTLYVLAIAGKFSGKLEISGIWYFQLFIWLAFLGLALVSICYLFKIHSAHGVNKHIAETAEEALIARSGVDTLKQLQRSLPEHIKSSFDPKFSVLKNNWAWRWQVVVLLGVAMIAAALLTFPLPKSQEDKERGMKVQKAPNTLAKLNFKIMVICLNRGRSKLITG